MFNRHNLTGDIGFGSSPPGLTNTKYVFINMPTNLRRYAQFLLGPSIHAFVNGQRRNANTNRIPQYSAIHSTPLAMYRFVRSNTLETVYISARPVLLRLLELLRILPIPFTYVWSATVAIRNAHLVAPSATVGTTLSIRRIGHNKAYIDAALEYARQVEIATEGVLALDPDGYEKFWVPRNKYDAYIYGGTTPVEATLNLGDYTLTTNYFVSGSLDELDPGYEVYPDGNAVRFLFNMSLTDYYQIIDYTRKNSSEFTASFYESTYLYTDPTTALNTPIVYSPAVVTLYEAFKIFPEGDLVGISNFISSDAREYAFNISNTPMETSFDPPILGNVFDRQIELVGFRSALGQIYPLMGQIFLPTYPILGDRISWAMQNDKIFYSTGELEYYILEDLLGRISADLQQFLPVIRQADGTTIKRMILLIGLPKPAFPN